MNLRISYSVVVKITKFFAFPLSFKIISFQVFGKASIICNQYILWVCLRWNSIFKSFQGFISSLLLNNRPIKIKFLSEKKRKMYRLTVNLNIWVKPNYHRHDHGWKSWFWSKVIYPFYEKHLDEKMEILKECHCVYQYYNETWNSYLNLYLLNIVVLLSTHEIIFKQSFNSKT